MYIAHKGKEGADQPLREHLENVANLSSEFARAFGAAEHARRTGLLHDKGKYGERAQNRQRDPEHTQRVPHAYAGAQAAKKERDFSGAFAIAGHHGGLMDMVPLVNGKLHYPSEDCSAFDKEIQFQHGELQPSWLKMPKNEQDKAACSMYTRMLFSCLVDADYLDTEAFLQGGAVKRGCGEPMEVLLAKMQNETAPWFPPKGEINEKRCEILTACAKAGDGPQGLYTLTVPTGGGKTASSLMFGLRHAVRHHLNRIIYVIPYTSIIEQNAAKFAEWLGEENILQHHAGMNDEDAGDDEVDTGLKLRKKLATENWDAPIVVTTAVQFFESLYAAKTSRCRKLHSMAGSVVIFDEAQMLPMPYLRPCVFAIAELVRHYGVTAVLCTATQPALDNLFKDYVPELEITEIMEHREELYTFFKRVTFQQEGMLAEEALCEELAKEEQALCIVNTRKAAQRIYQGVKARGKACYHLSTLMTPTDRSMVLNEVRQRLEEGKPCIVVSTSLIEAGVDVDFPTVWREKAGLDSILQAAGRCNREGKRSPEKSIVHVFELEGQSVKTFSQQTAATKIALEEAGALDSLEAIRVYSKALIHSTGDYIDKKEILKNSAALNFKTVEKDMRLIETDTLTIFIPTEDNEGLLEELRNGSYTRQTLRKLQKDSVNVYRGHAERLMEAGRLEQYEDFLVLADGDCYSRETGLALEVDPGAALFG